MLASLRFVFHLLALSAASAFASGCASESLEDASQTVYDDALSNTQSQAVLNVLRDHLLSHDLAQAAMLADPKQSITFTVKRYVPRGAAIYVSALVLKKRSDTAITAKLERADLLGSEASERLELDNVLAGPGARLNAVLVKRNEAWTVYAPQAWKGDFALDFLYRDEDSNLAEMACASLPLGFKLVDFAIKDDGVLCRE